jgi:hypothetical protein
MLHRNDLIREFPVVHKTDRDCESPLVVDFIKARCPLEALLDIGAHYSGETYGTAIRNLQNLKRHDGIDIQPADSATASILDHYYVGNANTFQFDLPQYDAVICVSTIEHSGVSTYQGDPVDERMKLFHRCLELARKHLFISFPIGQEYTVPGQLSVVTREQLHVWEGWCWEKMFKTTVRFFYSQGPQASHPWYEHTKRDVAVRVPYIDYIGNQSICVMEIDKT